MTEYLTQARELYNGLPDLGKSVAIASLAYLVYLLTQTVMGKVWAWMTKPPPEPSERVQKLLAHLDREEDWELYSLRGVVYKYYGPQHPQLGREKVFTITPERVYVVDSTGETHDITGDLSYREWALIRDKAKDLGEKFRARKQVVENIQIDNTIENPKYWA